jgi:hypothetical protein
MSKIKKAYEICEKFAKEYNLVLNDSGVVGEVKEKFDKKKCKSYFCVQHCVGFMDIDGNWFEYNNKDLIFKPPKGIPLYTKNNFFIVRGDYHSIKYLAKWVRNIYMLRRKYKK